MNEEHPDRVTLDLPEKDLVVVNIGGYKFFRGRSANDFQCATCINMMGTETAEDIDMAVGRQGVRKIKLIKDCDCKKQK